MSIRQVIIYPNKFLKEKSLPILEITDEVKTLATEMIETMYFYQGIGLAANQIGILKQIIVIDLQENEEKKPIILINPQIIQSSKELFEYEEGCLSIPKMKAILKRPIQILVTYMDINGTAQTIEAKELLATCLQHEIDHLNGKLFTDRLSKLKRDMLIKKFLKEQQKESDE